MTAFTRQFHRSRVLRLPEHGNAQAALELDVFTPSARCLDADALARSCDAAPRGIAAMCGLARGMDSSPSLVRDMRSQRTPRYSWTGPRPLASPPSTNSWQLRNRRLVFRDPAGRCVGGGSEGLANVAPDNPIWIRFARAMDPQWLPMRRLVANMRRSAPKKVLDYPRQATSLLASLRPTLSGSAT